MTTYEYTRSPNYGGIFSRIDQGRIDAENPEEALRHVCDNYEHPAGLYAAHIVQDEQVVARFLSSNAATVQHWKERGKEGAVRHPGNVTSIGGSLVEQYSEFYEVLDERVQLSGGEKDD